MNPIGRHSIVARKKKDPKPGGKVGSQVGARVGRKPQLACSRYEASFYLFVTVLRETRGIMCRRELWAFLLSVCYLFARLMEASG